MEVGHHGGMIALLSSWLHSRNLKIVIYKTIILPVELQCTEICRRKKIQSKCRCVMDYNPLNCGPCSIRGSGESCIARTRWVQIHCRDNSTQSWPTRTVSSTSYTVRGLVISYPQKYPDMLEKWNLIHWLTSLYNHLLLPQFSYKWMERPLKSFFFFFFSFYR